MTQWLSDDEQATWRAVLEMNRLLQEGVDHQLQSDAGFPVAYYAILVTLSEAPERRLRMSALAEAVEGSQSRLSHAVTRLEAKGWVRRRKCTSDKRGLYAELTDAGLAALTAAAPGHVAVVRRLMFDGLSRDQQHALRDLAATVVSHIRAAHTADFAAAGNLTHADAVASA